jgi:hypothetical protein
VTRLIASGDQYLVDVGKLVSVAAAGVRDAVSLATIGGDEFPEPRVYRMDGHGAMTEIRD